MKIDGCDDSTDSDGTRKRILRDSPNRSYADKLELFARFAERELRAIISEFSLPADARVLDLGCGTGKATALFREQLKDDGIAVGLDLSHPHLQVAKRVLPHTFVQADAAKICFSDHIFDLIWSCNTINHLDDRSRALRSLKQYVRQDGSVAIAQSGFLPEMFFAWDSQFDDAVRLACHRYYRERYALDAADTAGVRNTVGLMREAGYADIRARTHVIERIQPLAPSDQTYFEAAIFSGTWRNRIDPFLDDENRDKLAAYCEPDSSDYCLNRADFHHIQTLTVCEGRPE